MIKSLKVCFPCYLERLFLLSPSFLVKASWKVLKDLLDPETTLQKVEFLTREQYYRLQDFIDAGQLEQRFGGKLPSPRTYWPPTNTLEIGETHWVGRPNIKEVQVTNEMPFISRTSSVRSRKTVGPEIVEQSPRMTFDPRHTMPEGRHRLTDAEEVPGEPMTNRSTTIRQTKLRQTEPSPALSQPQDELRFAPEVTPFASPESKEPRPRDGWCGLDICSKRKETTTEEGEPAQNKKGCSLM
eukprot:TRINITY_DN2650_c0_g1_i1.p1 TRINITY_DN2650_c0_g1~~TRINITY_DN2650_c0_g1_i1.p1  ORF type:complete len:241 (+),score=42.58 TRINITY_DN2650_c0_g1_i1:418-1140(+)